MKFISQANIDTITSEVCKSVNLCLQDLRRTLAYMDSYFSFGPASSKEELLHWADHLWQLMIIIKDIPSLPRMRVEEAMEQPPSVFHPQLFRFLVREGGEEVFEQFQQLLPTFVNSEFTLVYKLHVEVSKVRDGKEVMRICRARTPLPDYFLNYLIRIRKIQEALLLREEVKVTEELVANQDYADEKQLLKEVYSDKTTLEEKEKILMKATLQVDIKYGSSGDHHL